MSKKDLVLRMLPGPLQDAAIRGFLWKKRRGLGDLKAPTAIILYVTDRCNLRCGHCFFWDSLNKKSPQPQVADYDRLAASLPHQVSLSLTGGEPFLRKDLEELVRCFTSRGKTREVAVATNGFFTEETLGFCRAFLAEHRELPLSVQVSLDGLEATHDAIRGCAGSFSRALETLRRLLALSRENRRFAASAGIAVQKGNLAELPELLDLLGKLGAEIRINLIRGESSGTFGLSQEASSHIDPKEGSSIALDLDEMRGLHRLLLEKNRAYGFWSRRHQRVYEIGMQVIEERRKVLDCHAGTIDAVIYANGEVAFCELTKPVGNLHDYDFDLPRLWESPAAVAMRGRVSRCFCTHGCNISTALMFEPEIVREAVLERAGKGGGR